MNSFVSALIICSPANEAGKTILQAIDKLGLAQDHNTLTILIDVSTLPSWLLTFNSNSHSNSSHLYNSSNLREPVSLSLLNSVGSSTKRYLLIFTDKILEDNTLETVLVAKLKNALDGEEDYRFVLLDLKNDSSWMPLLDVTLSNSSKFEVTNMWENLDDWLAKHRHGSDCDGCEEDELAKFITVLIVLICAGAFVAVVLGIAALARNQVIKKRLSKGPYKVLLSAADFVFPQLTTSRRVSYYMMLSIMHDTRTCYTRESRIPLSHSQTYTKSCKF